MPRLAPSLITAALAALAASGLVGVSAQAQPALSDAAAYAPGRVIVSFSAGASASERAAARAAAGARTHAPLSPLARDSELLDIGANDVPRAVQALTSNPNVRFAEPDWKVTETATSNDTAVLGGSTWGLYGPTSSPTNTYGSRAIDAWSAGLTGSSAVAVGIIDTGIDISHPDLANNIWTNPGETAGNGIDDDANGYIDDVNGWDFHFNDKTVFDSAADDDHGTHVAGTIGGVGGNGAGVAGVNWNVTMIPAKFLGPGGGYISNAVKAADYLTALKSKYKINLVASNNSWGGGGFSQAMLDAINRGGNAGILFVAAAGNGGNDGVGDNNDTTASYPSNYSCTTATRSWDCVVAVAAITSSGARASFSNYGAQTVDLGAPGQSIYSTLPTNSYAYYSGTSMATPHVTGAVALCRASFPDMSAQATRTTLMATSVATSSMGSTSTGGRLDAASFAESCAGQLAGDPTPPPPPTPPGAFGKLSPSNGATGLATQVPIKWQASSGAVSYEACLDTVNDNVCGGTWTNLGNVTAATARLQTKRIYYWQVRAINGSGVAEANGVTWWRLTTK